MTLKRPGQCSKKEDRWGVFTPLLESPDHTIAKGVSDPAPREVTTCFFFPRVDDFFLAPEHPQGGVSRQDWPNSLETLFSVLAKLPLILGYSGPVVIVIDLPLGGGRKWFLKGD